MPRGPRRDGTDATHHVMVRGIERRRIFHTDRDRRDLIGRLTRLCGELEVVCYAWVLLPNHFHLVIRADGSVSRFMARLNTGYARAFNERHGRVGYLFQNRFRSRLVVDDADLRGLVLYVHRNPIEAGITRSVADLAAYPWCGHGGLMGARPAYPFEAVGATLDLFAPQTSEARRCVARWLVAGMDRGAPDGRPVRILPGPLGLGRRESDRAHVDRIAGLVSHALGIDPTSIHAGERTRLLADARAATAFLAVEHLGVPACRVAEYLGVARSTVSRALGRGRHVAVAHRLDRRVGSPAGGE